MPHVLLAAESHHQVGANRIDEEDGEDNRFDTRHHARLMVRHGDLGLAHKIPDSRQRCCHLILKMGSDPLELWMQRDEVLPPGKVVSQYWGAVIEPDLKGFGLVL